MTRGMYIRPTWQMDGERRMMHPMLGTISFSATKPDPACEPQRVKLHAYVVGRGLWPTTFEGMVLPSAIYTAFPNECRYAVVETLSGTFEAWDFYTPWPRNEGGHIIGPPPTITGPTANAVIAQVILRHD